MNYGSERRATKRIPFKLHADITFAGKQYKLNCEIKWYRRGKGSDKSLTLGMKIANPPSKYTELIASLTDEKK